MIITRKWLEEWIDISEISSQKIVNTLNSIGLEVDSLTEVKIPSKVVVGYVKSKKKHENAEKLSVCEVDVGSEVLQIVCGAKNVQTGQFVAVALIGAELPGGLKIKKAKLRGVESNGMICSSVELGLPKINDGIMVLDDSIGKSVLGKELSEYEFFSDDIIEIELTPNRGDCLSIYGVARDLSAALDLHLRSISYSEGDALLGIGRLLSIHSSENTKSFFQFRAFSIKQKPNLKLSTKIRVGYAGIMQKNDLDTLLAYATYATGVLLRAYDANKLNGDRITLSIKDDEYGNSSVFDGENFLSMAGILQSDYARVDDDSKTMIIEASYTDPKTISVAMNDNKELKVGEHVYRSSRGSEPNLELGQNYFFNIISGIDGLSPYSGSQQVSPRKDPKTVSFGIDQINAIVGRKIDRNEVVKILKKLGFEVGIEQDLINTKVPAFRHDIENCSDIAEEIVRMIGIDNIPSKPLNFSEKNRLNESYKNFIHKRDLKFRAVGAEFFECIHYVFDSSSELKNLGFKECSVKIVNPITSELDTFRPTLINHLLKSAARNYKNSKKSIKLFEIGKVFDENANESENLAFLASGLVAEASILNSAKPKEIDFIKFATMIKDAIGAFKCEIPAKFIPYLSEFEQANVIVDGKVIGYIGRVNLELENLLDLPKTYICEIKFDELKPKHIVAKAFSKFPSVSRDLSIIAPKDMRYATIKSVLESVNIENLKKFNVVDIYTDEKLGDNNSITINFTFQSDEKTLEESEISPAMDEILKVLNDKLGIGIR
ncbi:phenylalanine--tRNA ligase subunit beta [Campylobacter corcagiensis]|uniref:Phenylalanine--tRNA ligase beta subunit n=1 Tax=Campylobacter corcagiensis TaxID=1448857 RepID=A0A7M1LFQ1_9BACT|nr:phenylalanine--tRNA ligase subunit beta [Campylobacter corcagiensis]QKF64382.1 phenylalanyl-tRNA synthetase, beta subunit [Campylobacter corcagiensis]QOQ87432.1 phenylalanine--tRNA ligase subunit beta [Campylobacter corcagiensis]